MRAHSFFPVWGTTMCRHCGAHIAEHDRVPLWVVIAQWGRVLGLLIYCLLLWAVLSLSRSRATHRQ